MHSKIVGLKHAACYIIVLKMCYVVGASEWQKAVRDTSGGRPKMSTTFSDLPDVPLRIIFKYLSKIDIANLQELGDDWIKEASIAYVGELGTFFLSTYLCFMQAYNYSNTMTITFINYFTHSKQNICCKAMDRLWCKTCTNYSKN